MREVQILQGNKVIAEYKTLEYDYITRAEKPSNFCVIGHIWGLPPEGEFSVVGLNYDIYSQPVIVTLRDCFITQSFNNGGDRPQFSGKYDCYAIEKIQPVSGALLIERALEIANRAHQKQVDKVGEPYILHPLRVMQNLWIPDFGINQGRRYRLMAAALLHDVLEDTSITAKELIELGIPEDVVEAVQYLTHYPHMSYEYYIKKVCSNPIALAVKKADIFDNLRPDRLALLPEETRSRLKKKYKQAMKLINQFEGEGEQNDHH